MYCNTKLVAPLQLHCNNCTGQCVAQTKATTHVGAHPRIFSYASTASSSSTLYTLPVTQLVEVETSFEASQLLDIELQLLLQLLQCCSAALCDQIINRYHSVACRVLTLLSSNSKIQSEEIVSGYSEEPLSSTRLLVTAVMRGHQKADYC